ncbi:MAG TPA: undecaprenyl-diphosphate phosphatase [Clostridia bacterium]|nr:undecaprenyl-diphosphate phosphatase [Clostridia bacterium]
MDIASEAAATWFALCVIGIVQGLTEFLPISSSAHLVFSQHFLGVRVPGLSIEVFAHLGTLCAVLLVFRHDVFGLLKGFCRLIGIRPKAKKGSTGKGATAWVASESYARLFVLIVIGSIPAGFFGFVFSDLVTAVFESIVWPAIFLIINGLILLSAQWALGKRRVSDPGSPRKGIWQIGVTDALIVGIAQAVAVFPGISRSGATVAAGIWRGIDRRAAASFSFLLSIPAVLGAALFDTLHLMSRSLPEATGQAVSVLRLTGLAGAAGEGLTAGLAIGGMPMEMLGLVALASFVTGALSIIFFFRSLDRGGLRGFAVYCLILGSLVLGLSKGLGLRL